jgi:ribosomal-protein-alanine N-acetyltransferase
MSSIAVRPAAELDFPAIARIQQTSPEAAQWPVGDYSGFEVLLALLHEGRTPAPAGFCAWRQTSPGEAELLNLAVAPEFRRRGVASALLRTLRGEAKGTIFLEVAEPNSAAISLYEHHGWVSTGLRKGYYQNGMINAVVMENRP